MEEKNDRLSQETPVEATDDAVLERLWANQPGAVSWKKKSPFGQPVSAAVPVSPTAPATPAAPQAEAVPEPPAQVEAAPPAPVTPPVEAVLQTAPPVVEAPQPPQVQPPEPVMKTEVRPAKQGGLWGTKSRTPVISGAVPGGVFGSGSQGTEKERPASLWGKEKAPAAGKGYGSASGSVWGKHAGQGSNPPAAGGTTWGKKAPAGERVCPQCGTPNPADARFCCMCRASLQEKTCPSCGKVIAVAQARYCPFCGADL